MNIITEENGKTFKIWLMSKGKREEFRATVSDYCGCSVNSKLSCVYKNKISGSNVYGKNNSLI
jgi:hypothetical protein